MSDFAYLRALAEAGVSIGAGGVSVNIDKEDVTALLGQSRVESTILVGKAALVFSRELSAAKFEPDKRKKLQKYKHALRSAKSLRRAATKIPADSPADHMWRIFTKPWWSSAYTYSSATVNGDLSSINKNSTITKFDLVIRFINAQIASLESQL